MVALRGDTDDMSSFAEGLEKVHSELEMEVRGFTFDLQAAWEKRGGAQQLREPAAQALLRGAYQDLVAWRTMVGQHCTGARMQADTGDATGEPIPDPYGLGPTVARNPLVPIAECAVEVPHS